MTYSYLQSENQVDKIQYSECVVIIESFLDIRELGSDIEYTDLVDIDIQIPDVYLATVRNFNSVIDTVKKNTKRGDLITVVSSNHNGNICFANMSLGTVLMEQLNIEVRNPTDPCYLVELLNSVKDKWSKETDLFGTTTLDEQKPDGEIQTDIFTKIRETPKI